MFIAFHFKNTAKDINTKIHWFSIDANDCSYLSVQLLFVYQRIHHNHLCHHNTHHCLSLFTSICTLGKNFACAQCFSSCFKYEYSSTSFNFTTATHSFSMPLKSFLTCCNKISSAVNNFDGHESVIFHFILLALYHFFIAFHCNIILNILHGNIYTLMNI